MEDAVRAPALEDGEDAGHYTAVGRECSWLREATMVGEGMVHLEQGRRPSPASGGRSPQPGQHRKYECF